MPISLLITLTDEAKADTQSVAKQLKELGLRVDTVLPIGVVGGTAEEKDVAAIRSCPGVATVDVDGGASV